MKAVTASTRAGLVLVSALMVPNSALAGTVGNMFSKFDRTMATFDPIGKHIRQPIERAIPRLQFRGFFRQWTDVLVDTHGDVGFRDQDFRFLQLQNLFELETSYHVAEGLDVKGVLVGLRERVHVERERHVHDAAARHRRGC